MFEFRTASGTTWKVDNGRITRIPDAYTPPEVAYRDCPPIVDMPFRWIDPVTGKVTTEGPVVGQQAHFQLLGDSLPSRTGLVTTIIGRRLVGVAR